MNTMPSFISRLQRSFLRKKSDLTASKTTTGPAVQSEADLHAPEKEAIIPSSASYAPPSGAKGNLPSSPHPPKSPTTRSIPLLSKSNSKKFVNKSKPAQPLPQIAIKLSDPSSVEQPAEPFISGVGQVLLDKQVLDEKRLMPEEALQLVRSAGAVVVERGLDTLGIFRPHWHSENAFIQQTLLSLYVSSLGAGKATVIGPPSPAEAFNAELRYTSDPHDVTSIIKWGLRHLDIEGGAFGQSDKSGSIGGPEWTWYRDFNVAEQQAGYPSFAFTSILLPRLSPIQGALLSALLDLISSVAAHVAQNAMSGNRLSKALAYWVIAPRATRLMSFTALYEQWDTASRIMEHLFLSFVRDMERQHKLPTRLTELIAHYPFNKPPVSDLPNPPRPPRPDVTTHQFKALYVRIEKMQSSGQVDEPKLPPLQLLREALIAQYGDGFQGPAELKSFWEDMKSLSLPPDEGGEHSETPVQLSPIVAEESLRVMSLSTSDTAEGLVPEFSATPPRRSPSGRSKRRSFSMDHGRSKPPYGSLTVLYEDAAPATRGRSQEDLAVSANGEKVDWDSFSSAGFGIPGPAASLADSLSGRSLNGVHSTSRMTESGADKRRSMRPLPAKDTAPSYVTGLSLVSLDEAFIDVWSDCLLDPLARQHWPEFLLCHLSDGAKLASGDVGAEWLIVEREVSTPTVVPKTQAIQRSPSNVSAATTTRFTRSFGRATAELASRKRFSLFSTSSGRSVRGRKESSGTIASKHTGIGELGELPPLPGYTLATDGDKQMASIASSAPPAFSDPGANRGTKQ
ncbi:hypothetical protein CALCODRAFT_255744 [Calocera cornea HHB12733]|uniref:Meiotically up-regulated protein Msb1/Mug8 domain-containing protein n=1 Tax=Calocera cornea HHB12733 TaxID=1353952 RepID=A0A165GJH0_9BASI|nr:hypothetical protein CALCODRAFT_255744 [Calocera cornea HHB12733]